MKLPKLSLSWAQNKIARRSNSLKYIRVDPSSSSTNLGHLKNCLECHHGPEIHNIVLKETMDIAWKLWSRNKGNGPTRHMKD